MTTIKAAIKSCVVLVADNTDLLVLLLFHAKNLVHDILMLSQHSTKKTHVWSVIHTKQQLNAEVTENRLFGHALMGRIPKISEILGKYLMREEKSRMK